MTGPMLYAFHVASTSRVFHLLDCSSIQSQMERGKYAGRCTQEEGERFGYHLCHQCANRDKLRADGIAVRAALQKVWPATAGTVDKSHVDIFLHGLKEQGRKIAYMSPKEKEEFDNEF